MGVPTPQRAESGPGPALETDPGAVLPSSFVKGTEQGGAAAEYGKAA